MNTDELLRRLGKMAPLTLGNLPTPLHPLTRLSAAVEGPELWIKRDDLTGLGLGGNKVRKLAFLIADALRSGADMVMTAGARQSNHARQTAAAAARVGLPCTLVLGGTPPEGLPEGNYFLDQLFGAEVRWARGRPLEEALEAEAAALREAGRHPHVIPYGGSNEVGVCGFVAAFIELVLEAEERNLEFDALIVASSSGGTQAGLVLAARALGLPLRIVGISIAEPAARLRGELAALANATAALLELELELSPEEFEVVDTYLGGGYGRVSATEREAIRRMARTEGLVVDPVYTGRALGGMLDLIRQGVFSPGERLLFWHTGGFPALFAYTAELL